MAKKKIDKWQLDIARAQAISGVPLDRCTWWQKLSKASTQKEITEVVNTPMLSDITDEDTSKTEK